MGHRQGRNCGYAAMSTPDAPPNDRAATLDSIGRYIELWDNSAVFKDLFQMVEDAAIGWDGHDPVRALPR